MLVVRVGFVCYALTSLWTQLPLWWWVLDNVTMSASVLWLFDLLDGSYSSGIGRNYTFLVSSKVTVVPLEGSAQYNCGPTSYPTVWSLFESCLVSTLQCTCKSPCNAGDKTQTLWHQSKLFVCFSLSSSLFVISRSLSPIAGVVASLDPGTFLFSFLFMQGRRNSPGCPGNGLGTFPRTAFCACAVLIAML